MILVVTNDLNESVLKGRSRLVLLSSFQVLYPHLILSFLDAGYSSSLIMFHLLQTSAAEHKLVKEKLQILLLENRVAADSISIKSVYQQDKFNSNNKRVEGRTELTGHLFSFKNVSNSNYFILKLVNMCSLLSVRKYFIYFQLIDVEF